MVLKVLITAMLLGLVLDVAACTAGVAAAPHELFALSIGMTRQAAEAELGRIAILERREDGRQEVWRLNSDPRFSSLAVGFDKEDRLRYLTAFVDKAAAQERVAFSDMGDLSKAKAEVTGQHHRYIWTYESAGYDVTVYGDDPKFLTMYTLVTHSDDRGKESDDDD